MLEVGKDSYVTLDDADTYVTRNYRSKSKERQRWNELETEDKEILLRQSCKEMEALPYQGRKASRDQQLAFPRLPLQYGRDLEPPDSIKAAQIELALWMSDDDKQADAEQRQALQAQGVESFSLGDLSETYTAGSKTGQTALLSPKAAQLLKPYLSGGYAMC